MPTADFEVMPGLMCGQTYRDQTTEAAIPNWRADEITSYTGCGNPMTWAGAYRCRQCARWMHGPCLDRHFEE